MFLLAKKVLIRRQKECRRLFTILFEVLIVNNLEALEICISNMIVLAFYVVYGNKYIRVHKVLESLYNKIVGNILVNVNFYTF